MERTLLGELSLKNRFGFALAALSTLLFAKWAFAADQYKLETAFIYQFTNYIEWPESARSEVFIVSVVGESPLRAELENLAKTKKIQGRSVEVLAADDASKLKRSNIVVMTTDDAKMLKSIVEKTKGTSTLIVSSADGFTKLGSMVNFFLEDGRLRFEINRKALESEKLVVSSQLLKLARLVE